MYTKLTIKKSDFCGYNIFMDWIRDSDKKEGQDLIASGFSKYQDALDYARLKCYNCIKLVPEYDFSKKEKEALNNIRDEVANQYCSWDGFIDCVINSESGVAGLLNLINKDTKIQKIVNNYI